MFIWHFVRFHVWSLLWSDILEIYAVAIMLQCELNILACTHVEHYSVPANARHLRTYGHKIWPIIWMCFESLWKIFCDKIQMRNGASGWSVNWNDELSVIDRYEQLRARHINTLQRYIIASSERGLSNVKFENSEHNLVKTYITISVFS